MGQAPEIFAMRLKIHDLPALAINLAHFFTSTSLKMAKVQLKRSN